MERWRHIGCSFLADRSLRLRAVLLLACAVAAVAAGFVLPDARTAEKLLRHAGWAIMAAAFAGAGWALAEWLRRAWTPRPWRAVAADYGPALAVLAGAVWLALASEPRGFKVVNDEYVLQATALNLHLEREPSALVRAYRIEGVFTPLLGYADKRPLAFPFLLSVVHDLTGYRVSNAFVLNYALAAVSLALLFVLGWRLSGSRPATLAGMMLWGGLPLLVQNANGSGMDLLNTTMIGLAILLAWDYLAAPDEPRLTALLFATVILAQSRYESAVFVPLAAAVAVAGWWSAGRAIVPWAAVATPLLLLPYAWQHQITSANKALWELAPDQETRFGLLYFYKNIAAAWEFFFAWRNRVIANSWLLSATTAIAVGAFAVTAARAWRRWLPLRPAAAVAAYGLAVLANLALLMFYYWGRLSDPVAARLALPSLFLGTLATVWLIGRCAVPFPAAGRWALALVLVYVVGFMRPLMANRYYTEFNIAVQQVRWEKDVLRNRPPAERLIVSNKTVLPWIVDRWSAIALSNAGERREALRFHLAAGTFGEIIVTQRLEPRSVEGDYAVEAQDALPPDFRCEVIAEKRFGVALARISRLVAVGEAPPP